ncbi:hypothetical protein, partial [Sphaerimonospora thailandensis]|uniref:hypothetical protein n=1 Tax=Sphaerimonospora thailandensis TaxID=795644 RepID=UPI00194DB22C
RNGSSQVPTDPKSEVYQRLGLRLTYHPGKAKARAEVNLSPHIVKRFVSEGGLQPNHYARIAAADLPLDEEA